MEPPDTPGDGAAAGEPATAAEPSTAGELVTLWGLVVEGYGATARRLGADCEPRFGRSVAELEVLVRLARTPGHRLPAGALARESSLTGGGLTRMVDRLLRDGLVRRTSCPQDRRVVWVEATDGGLALAGQACGAFAEFVRRDVVEVLGAERAGQLAAAMRALRDHHRGGRAPVP